MAVPGRVGAGFLMQTHKAVPSKTYGNVEEAVIAVRRCPVTPAKAPGMPSVLFRCNQATWRG